MLHFADLALARRLERAEGQTNVDFVEARAAASPDTHAQWVDVDGTLAMFDGADSPLTQTFMFGMNGAVADDALERLEAFFRDRAAPVFHEVSPLADGSAVAQLNARRYQPLEFTSVMYRALNADVTIAGRPGKRVQVRTVASHEYDTWAQTAADGWSDAPGMREFMLGLSLVSARRKHGASFLALVDDQPIATGGVSLFDGVALLAGASTIPTARQQGAQQGCDLAMMCALPGSASQRNAERHGFRVAYTRIKWRLPVWSE